MTGNSHQTDGLAALLDEMSRQRADALASFDSVAPAAAEAAAAVAGSGRLLLLGMGASHAIGRAVEPLYRQQGIDAVAIPLSEQIDQPLPRAGWTTFITSQSGESVEVVRWLEENAPVSDAFGLTMDPHAALARALPSLVGAGGAEKALAATRSALVTVALHGAVLSRLGADQEPMLRALRDLPEPDISAALERMEDVNTIITSARRVRGLAELLGLGLVELSRLPCATVEAGQFRHGLMEMLTPAVGVVLLCAAEPSAELVRRLAAAIADTGAPVVLFDASGDLPVPGLETVALPQSAGLAGLVAILLAQQKFMVRFAAARVADVGTPLRSQKVTRME